MRKRIAILQSNYIPWKGYFDLINSVDEFVLFDDAQYTKNDWRNRNVIKTKQGLQWLTIPVTKVSLSQKIRNTNIANQRWQRKHWSSLRQNYSKAPFFDCYRDIFEHLYLSLNSDSLSEVNFQFIRAINQILGIETKLTWSSSFEMIEGRTARLVNICKQCGASEYLSGPAAKSYFDIDLAERENVKVTWMNYQGYPEYLQLYPPFEHSVSILDLIFTAGPDAKNFMKSF